MWLEAKLFPNEPLDPSWGNESCHMARGFFQVVVGYRPGTGQVRPLEVAEVICAHFGKGVTLGPVRVRKAPWPSPEITDSDKLLIPVTIPYAGFVE